MAPTTQITISSNENNVALDNSGNGNGNGKARVAKCNPHLLPNRLTIRGVVGELLMCANQEKKLIPLALGDASSYPCFAAGKKAFTEAVVAAVSSGGHDCYVPSFGLSSSRR